VINAAISGSLDGDPDLDPEDWREMVSKFQALAGPWPMPAPRTRLWDMTWCRPYPAASIA
jgi:hypothetical protein